MKPGRIYRHNQPIVPLAWRADRPWSRLRGLLGRPPLAPHAQQALWLIPCGGIHTFGMTYPLDIVFLNRDGHVLDWHEHVDPWRLRQCRGAHQTIELAPGSLACLAPQCGECWQWQSK